MDTIKIASRKSNLAVAQSEEVAELLGSETQILTFTTKGDEFLKDKLENLGGKGLFVKEIEEQLLNGNAHIAVHSAKDLETTLPDELTIGAYLKREDAADVFISKKYSSLAELPHGAVLGTASIRRELQVKNIREDLQIKTLRGNVNTRLSKIESGDYDATIMAHAGLKRLGLTENIKEVLNVENFLPAVAQGAIAVECRKDDEKTLEVLSNINDAETQICVTAERTMLKILDGSCRTPIAGNAKISGDKITLTGFLGAPSTHKFLQISETANVADAQKLGEELGKKLKADFKS